MLEISFEQRTQLCTHAKRLPSFFDLLFGLLKIEIIRGPFLLFYITYSFTIIYNRMRTKREKKIHFHICIRIDIYATYVCIILEMFGIFQVFSFPMPFMASLKKSRKYVPISIKSFEKPKIGILSALKSICRFLFSITSQNRYITERERVWSKKKIAKILLKFFLSFFPPFYWNPTLMFASKSNNIKLWVFTYTKKFVQHHARGSKILSAVFICCLLQFLSFFTLVVFIK